jgi:hypothetical protein
VIPRMGLLVAALSVAGCGPFFNAVSAPPVGRTAQLDARNDTIEISAGVALAFECRGSVGDPCVGASATTDDPAIARVLPAYLDRTSGRGDWYGGGYHGPAPRSVFVVYGVAPGKTSLRVRSERGNQELPVTVLE